MNIKIIQKHFKEGKWFVIYKEWPEGECFCMAVKKKVELSQMDIPTVKNVKEAVG